MRNNNQTKGLKLMELAYLIFVHPFLDMANDPAFLLQTLWEGLVSGVLYTLIALGFVLIYKASGIFNFAQGIIVVFAALTLIGFYQLGLPAYGALIATILVLYLLAMGVERVVLRPLVGQHDAILLMATIGLTFFLIGLGEFIFGGENKIMITEQLMIPQGGIAFSVAGKPLLLEKAIFSP